MILAYSEVWSSAPNRVSKTAKKDKLCFIYILPQLKKCGRGHRLTAITAHKPYGNL